MLSDYCTDEPKSTARCGTMGFMAPEMLRDNGVPYDSACDVFSYGCTLYEITHNAVPFVEYDPKQPDNQEFQHFRSLVLSGQRPQIDPHRVTEGMKQLILWCWGDAPYSRPNMIQCVKRLEMLRTEYQIW
jgi:serine/threonine protein kinase